MEQLSLSSVGGGEWACTGLGQEEMVQARENMVCKVAAPEEKHAIGNADVAWNEHVQHM